MFNRTTLLLRSACVAIAAGLGLAGAQAQETVKIGLILPMTGGQASTGKQIDNAVKLYMQQTRRHRRRQEDRTDPQGRRRRCPTTPSAWRRN